MLLPHTNETFEFITPRGEGQACLGEILFFLFPRIVGPLMMDVPDDSACIFVPYEL